jgi:hypothetical protein
MRFVPLRPPRQGKRGALSEDRGEQAPADFTGKCRQTSKLAQEPRVVPEDELGVFL